MKNIHARFIGYCVNFVVIVSLLLLGIGCSSKTPTLSTVTLTPSSVTQFTIGSTQQFTATATYSDGTTKDITSKVTWASSDNAVVSLSTAGLATGIKSGNIYISVTFDSVVSNIIILRVVTLLSIAITPDHPDQLAVGSTLQFTATGTYTDGTKADITSQATWDSSDNKLAAVDSTGLVTGNADGNVEIVATLDGVSGTAVTLTVVTPLFSAIAIEPSSLSQMAVGTSLQFTATGTDSNGKTTDISSQVTWTSSNINVATVSSTGLATGVTAGSTDISAFLTGIASPVVILRIGVLSSISIIPTSLDVLATGLFRTFRAVGTYADGSTSLITSQVTWASSNPSIATVQFGVASGIRDGDADITAALAGVTSTAVNLHVSKLLSITIAPASPAQLSANSTVQFTATATYSDGTTADITSQVTWTSSNTAISTVSLTGLATGIAAGSTNIKATLVGVTSLTVSLKVGSS